MIEDGTKVRAITNEEQGERHSEIPDTAFRELTGSIEKNKAHAAGSKRRSSFRSTFFESTDSAV